MQLLHAHNNGISFHFQYHVKMDPSLDHDKNQIIRSNRLKSVVIWFDSSPINNRNCQILFPNNLDVLPDQKWKDNIQPVCSNFSVLPAVNSKGYMQN